MRAAACIGVPFGVTLAPSLRCPHSDPIFIQGRGIALIQPSGFRQLTAHQWHSFGDGPAVTRTESQMGICDRDSPGLGAEGGDAKRREPAAGGGR
jgi:hypothetical protein